MLVVKVCTIKENIYQAGMNIFVFMELIRRLDYGIKLDFYITNLELVIFMIKCVSY